MHDVSQPRDALVRAMHSLPLLKSLKGPTSIEGVKHPLQSGRATVRLAMKLEPSLLARLSLVCPSGHGFLLTVANDDPNLVIDSIRS